MSFEQLIKSGPPLSLKNDTPVSPTLVLGLGGTGKEVLLRLRRLIVERFGSLKELPCVEFLHIDTDQKQTAKEQYDLKADDDALYKKLMFQPAETIPLNIDGGTSRYINHIGNYPHIKRWFQHRGKIAGLGDLGEGAGQVRMASRLALFHEPNFTRIADSLNRIKTKLQDPTITEKVSRHNLQFDPNSMEVYIITSVGGGTGSGIFLDMGFLVKQIFGDAERVAMLFMPKLYQKYAGHPRIYANGYAALMELNKYSFGHKFIANWDGRNMRDMLPPPFSYTYLIDATNDSNFTENNEKSLYQMTAETIFQDYSIGGFAGMKRSTRVNLVQYTMGVYVHNHWDIGMKQKTGANGIQVKGDTYPTRFSSLGLGVISFPANKVHNACASRLAQNILISWKSKLTEDPLEKLVVTFLTKSDINFFQGKYERRDGGGILEQMNIEDELLYYNKSAGQTFENYLWEKCLNAQQDIQTAAKGNLSNVLHDHRSRFEQLMTKEDSDDSKEWGEDIRLIEENMVKYLKQLKEGIQREADRLANSPDHGIAYALSILATLKELLPKGVEDDSFKYLQYFEDTIPWWREDTTAYLGQLDQLHLELDKHDRSLIFRSDDIKRDLEHVIGTKTEPGVLYNYMFARVMKQVAKRGKQICLEIDEFLGKNSATGKGLLSKYYRLLGGFEKLNALFKNKEQYFSRDFYKEKGYSFWVSLYQEGDVDKWYERWMGKGKQEETNVEEIGNRILKEIFKVDTVTEALARIEKTPEEEIEEEVLTYCKKHFAAMANQPSALEMLMDSNRFSKNQREQLVKRAYDMARIWVKGGGVNHVNVHSPGSGQKPCYIGVDGNDHVRRKEFLDIIDNSKRAGEITSPLDIGESNKSAIVFYNELAGVTAFYPTSVSEQGGLKQRYNEFYSNSGKFDPDNQEELHTHKSRFQFTDLIPKTDEEAIRYKKAIRAFVLARLLGMLSVEIRDDGDTLDQIYCYEYRDPHDQTVHEETLGDEPNAIDLLYRESGTGGTWRDQINDKTDEVINTLIRKKKLANYLLLIEFYQREVYPPQQEKEKDRQDMFITRFSPQYAILETERLRVYKKILIDDQKKTQVVTALNALRGGNDANAMTHQDYGEALKPFTKTAGKFERFEETAIGELRATLLDAYALDMGSLGMSKEKSAGNPVKKSKPTVEPDFEKEEEEQKAKDPAAMTRPCPKCGQEINIRAPWCVYCKKEVSKYVECPRCGETKVPNDLRTCWSCGNLMELEEKIDCPRCYSFKGYKREFPCKACGFDFAGEDREPPAGEYTDAAPSDPTPDTYDYPPHNEPEEDVTPVKTEEPPEEAVDTGTGYPSAGSSAAPTAEEYQEHAPGADEAAETDEVECQNCFSMVKKAQRCPICQAPLEF